MRELFYDELYYTKSKTRIQIIGRYEQNPWVLIASDRMNREEPWLKSLQEYFVTVLSDRAEPRDFTAGQFHPDTLHEILAKVEEEKGIRKIGLLGVGEYSKDLLQVVNRNPFGISFVIFVNPPADVLEDSKVLPVPLGVVLGLGASEEEDSVRAAFEKVAAPDKVIYEIKKGGTCPMDAQPALFTIAIRQSVYRLSGKK